MKKLITLLMLVTLTSVSAQQSKDKVDYKSNYNSDELLEIGKTILDPVEKYEFYKHLYIVYQIDDLKETVDDLKKDYEIEQENDELRNKSIEEFRQLSKPILYDFAKKYLSEYTVVNEKPISLKQLDQIDEYEESTLRDKLKNVDKLLIEKDSAFYEDFSRLVQPTYGQCGSNVVYFDKNMIVINAGCGTGMSEHYNYVMLKNNEFIDLGNGYNKLTKSEFKN